MNPAKEKKRLLKVSPDLHKKLKMKALIEDKKLEDVVDEVIKKGLEGVEK